MFFILYSTFKKFSLEILTPIAQIEKESPESQKLLFSCLKRATNGSSFSGLEKQLL
jgi:hypothetical protein